MNRKFFIPIILGMTFTSDIGYAMGDEKTLEESSLPVSVSRIRPQKPNVFVIPSHFLELCEADQMKFMSNLSDDKVGQAFEEIETLKQYEIDGRAQQQSADTLHDEGIPTASSLPIPEEETSRSSVSSQTENPSNNPINASVNQAIQSVTRHWGNPTQEGREEIVTNLSELLNQLGLSGDLRDLAERGIRQLREKGATQNGRRIL